MEADLSVAGPFALPVHLRLQRPQQLNLSLLAHSLAGYGAAA